ncbi:MAG: sulfate adenylyltransferase [Thermoplasmata archaeon]|nr:MAG: sulfate adenylyltransferase [Thermoplasmata archaeon]
MPGIPKPHGGRLVERVLSEKRRLMALEEAKELQKIDISKETAVDVENIARGVFSPLEGFMTKNDYESVLETMRLEDDTPWTIPIVLDISKEDLKKKGIKEGDEIVLEYNGIPIAFMAIEEIYDWNKKYHAVKVFKTDDVNHPGVARTYGMKDRLIGGRIELINSVENPFERYTLWPKETRVLFKHKGWKTIAAFQTRNAPHMGHEYVQKTALTLTDGLFINPLIGRKKKGDFKDEAILKAYEVLIENYYPRDRVVLAILRTEMRYAGPREAIFHAILRKNFGCTHFIVGRDHAGVGNYYGPYEAHEIFKEFPDLGIEPIFFREFFYCKKCMGYMNEKTCPHRNTEYVIRPSGTKIREMLLQGKMPPKEMMRPEVAKVLLEFGNPFVE